jgi:mRNA interferase MazF
MEANRGELWLANLDPTRGSEQAGTRPVLVFQNDRVSRYTTTVLAIPLTTNLRRAGLPSCLRIARGADGLTSDSVLLCHQMRVLDKSRLLRRIGPVDRQTLVAVEARVLFTLGIIETTSES